MNKSKKLVFFGNERLATGLAQIEPLTLKSLVAQGYDVAAVVSHFHEGHSRNQRTLEIAEVAKAHNIPLLLPENLRDIKQKIESYQAEVAILVAYGKIIPADIIEVFPKGIINIHPSLLPKYRGPTPVEQAILDGATETGVSIMKLAPKMDAGPVFAQDKLTLSGQEYKAELAKKLLEAGSKLLLKNLPAIFDGSLQPALQDDSQAIYTKLLTKADGIVDWSEPAEALERKIRAFDGFPKTKINLFNNDIVITKSRVAQDENDGDLVVKCQPGWLEVQELTAPSGRSISGAEFIRGYKKD
jgi:methionyl-tRNA formyltransferase